LCPDLLLTGLVGAFAAMFYLLHTAITKKGRKKRSSSKPDWLNFVLVTGMERFRTLNRFSIGGGGLTRS
jgi:hypothetical protein